MSLNISLFMNHAKAAVLPLKDIRQRAWTALLIAEMGCVPSTGERPSGPSEKSNASLETVGYIVSPDPVSLGKIRPGRAASVDFELHNRTAMRLAVDRIKTSCPCIQVTPRTVRIEPGDSARLTVTYDPTEAPEFRGALSARVDGYATERLVFQTQVNLDVLD